MHLGAIFVVEDDAATGRLICNTLLGVTSGYEIVLTSHISTVMAQVSKRWIPLIIASCQLRDMGALESIWKVKKRSPQTKILVISEVSGPKILETIIGVGADRLLSKPFTKRDLLMPISDLLCISSFAA